MLGFSQSRRPTASLLHFGFERQVVSSMFRGLSRLGSPLFLPLLLPGTRNPYARPTLSWGDFRRFIITKEPYIPTILQVKVLWPQGLRSDLALRERYMGDHGRFQEN